jgi:Flp pilus assembly protein TadG
MSFPKRTVDRRHTRDARRHRRGTACVEFAALSPILLLLILGVIDVGQFVNIGQSVSNASREGARVAARQTTTDCSKVDNAVTNYLTNLYPNLPSSAVQCTVSSAGNQVTSGGIATVATGTPVTVQVVVQFDPVRWINGFTFLAGRSVTKSTVTRRE